MERERHNQFLPAEVGNAKDGYHLIQLPDYITLTWYSPVLDDFCEMQVPPDKEKEFMYRQEKIEGKGVIWLDQQK